MKLPEIDTAVTPRVMAIRRRWKAALQDESETAIAPAFDVRLDAGSSEHTRLNLDAWWSAPERAAQAGLVAAELPAEWETFWRRRSEVYRRLVSFIPFIHRSYYAGQVKVWPGATCFIRSAPKGSELPWLVGVESALSIAVADEGVGVVMLRRGVNRERAGQALLAGERTVPEQSFAYPADDNWRTMVERVHARGGWIFVMLETGRVLAVKDLQVEQPGIG